MASSKHRIAPTLQPLLDNVLWTKGARKKQGCFALQNPWLPWTKRKTHKKQGNRRKENKEIRKKQKKKQGLEGQSGSKRSHLFRGWDVESVRAVRGASGSKYTPRIFKGYLLEMILQGDREIIFLCRGQSVSRRGGRNKGGLKQMRANANKRRQTLTNASKRRGENASKRKQTRANVDKRQQTLTPPLIAVFAPPFAIPLVKLQGNSAERARLRSEFAESNRNRWRWTFAPLNRNVSLFKSAPEIAASSSLQWKFATTIANIPKGPKIEKLQDLPPGFKMSSENDNFKRATHQGLHFEGQDWTFQARLKFSSVTENFKRVCFLHSAAHLFSSDFGKEFPSRTLSSLRD